MSHQKDDFSFRELYVYSPREGLVESLNLLYFDSLTLEQKTQQEFEKQRPTAPPAVQNARIVQPTARKTDKQPEPKLDDYQKFNLRRTSTGLSAVSEEDFDKMMDQLSISGSESEEEEQLETTGQPDPNSDSTVSFLHTRSPFVLFSSSLLPTNLCFGAYKTTLGATTNDSDPLGTLRTLSTQKKHLKERKSALFMIGGGHFAGAIISHEPYNTKGNQGTPDELRLQSVQILEQKSFHRYTTRRKQGGSQSANDNAKGKAKSAGSNLRRYNEQALEQDVRELLNNWRSTLDQCDNIFIKATGVFSRKSLMNYTDAPIRSNDPRVKFFPFVTNRATSTEIKRAWCELTHLRVMEVPKVDREQVERQLRQQEALAKSKIQQSREHKKEEQSEGEQHTNELVALLKKSKAPALISFVKKNKIDVNFPLEPAGEFANTPSLLHYSSVNKLSHMCQVLLVNLKADPTLKNKFGRTAYEIAGNDQTKYAFQVSRSSLGEDYCDWEKEAKVPEAKTKEEVDLLVRAEKEKSDLESKRLIERELENARREVELEREQRHGPGKVLVPPKLTEQQNLNSLTPEQRMKVMREMRARAAEERLKKK